MAKANPSPLIESLRRDLAQLREAGAIDATVQQGFDTALAPDQVDSGAGNENPGSGPGRES